MPSAENTRGIAGDTSLKSIKTAQMQRKRRDFKTEYRSLMRRRSDKLLMARSYYKVPDPCDLIRRLGLEIFVEPGQHPGRQVDLVCAAPFVRR
jgi:hypothetical protein